MTQPVLQSSGYTPRVRTYSAWFRRVLSIAALVTAISPAPVMLFQLLPAYSVQAKFLIFYAPLVCFLTSSYLFYVRDALARAMFADLLNPPPEPDPYYGEAVTASLRRVVRRLRSVLLALLPVVLLIASSYCAVEYLRLFNRSVGQATEQKRREVAIESERVELRDSRREGPAPKAKSRGSRRQANALASNDTARMSLSADSLRPLILRTADMDDIPFFARLNILFIGIFLSAEIAFILMALKEYAKEALGLTERDLMVGLDPRIPS